MKNTIQNISIVFLAILMVIFGLNKFFGFIPVEPPVDPTAQAFMGAMFTSYLFVVVAIGEIVGGILLIVPKTRFLGWLLLLPVIFNIVAFHIAHDFIGNGIWLLPTLLFAVITYFQLGTVKKAMNYGQV
ncbi:DoxX-like protein [Maribacter spongiicola]|uniref:DoxX-like protein n=1 Tax=Maribacter spongiicola TaxID=1206753 RepID=A0A4R7K4R5_9FLAO|nr:DoxX family membrane protein [Maribacter spongiicola]TDT45033.1 DoxX-like protein [Maribacter spongiicola]